MKNGVGYSDLKKMSEQEVIEFYMIITEESLYEKEQIDSAKVSV